MMFFFAHIIAKKLKKERGQKRIEEVIVYFDIITNDFVKKNFFSE